MIDFIDGFNRGEPRNFRGFHQQDLSINDGGRME